MHFNDYLQQMLVRHASDLYLSGGAKPSMRVHGKIEAVLDSPMNANTIGQFAHDIMSEAQWHEFQVRPELNLAVTNSDGNRFRVNIFRQRDEIAMVIRRIQTDIPTFKDLSLPDIFCDLAMMKRGLILVAGATSSGKSTTLASMLDYRNHHSSDHIITIEDPIEFIYEHKQSVVNQREVGIDTRDYGDALCNALRQSPDVIQVGEIRSRDIMEHAIAYAETGHLCFSTLHANNSAQTLDRIINFFTSDRRQQLLLDLSLNLRAVISQRLIPAKDGKRILALELLLVTPIISKFIKTGEIEKIKEVMEKSTELGMRTFDMSLVESCQAGKITEEEAISNADSQNNVRLQLSMAKGVQHTPGSVKLAMEKTSAETDRSEFLNWVKNNGGEKTDLTKSSSAKPHSRH
ncbi:MAG: PilT/PilU family type 4a pilus ATPase [Gammaproteobacteria bacterium]|jgi:twitching motility protein PilU|nr:PilT/PilU family type 4a pilus ATPase [Gammaproteobacteria bacterium]